jgi:preprotein translocase subunit YajC
MAPIYAIRGLEWRVENPWIDSAPAKDYFATAFPAGNGAPLVSAYALFQTNLGPKADNAAPQTVTTQPAADTHAAPAASGGSSSLMNSLPILLLVVMVPMLLLSSRKGDKREQAARAGMKKGDRVMSDSGLIGDLIELGDKTCKVKLAPGITVEMMTNKLLPLTVAAASKDDKLKDLKDAKSDAKSSAAPAAIVSAEKK